MNLDIRYLEWDEDFPSLGFKTKTETENINFLGKLRASKDEDLIIIRENLEKVKAFRRLNKIWEGWGKLYSAGENPGYSGGSVCKFGWK